VLRVDQRAERIGRGEGGQIARAAVIADRPAVVVDAGLGEQAGELDLAGCGTPAGLLAGPALGSGGHARHSGAVHRDVEGVDGLVADLELTEAAVSSIPACSARSSRAWPNGWLAARRATMRRSPGVNDAPAIPSSMSRGANP
jgi:hypothetical protein